MALSDLDKNRHLVIYGAGAAGRRLNRLCQKYDITVAAFVDDNHEIHGTKIDSVMVEHPQSLDRFDDQTQLVFALPQLSDLSLMTKIKQKNLTRFLLYTICSYEEMLKAPEAELIKHDLLLLKPLQAIAPMRLRLAGKTVFVTGAAGSIGSEIVRQLIMSEADSIVCFDHNEYGLYSLKQELDQISTQTEIVYRLGNLLDTNCLQSIFAATKFDLVCHAAAYKHVPLMQENIFSGMQNNILGTLNVISMAADAGTPDFCLISTDKAVRPTNYMGASKRICEWILLAHAAHFRNAYSVRFGNVINSSGSVVPLFQQQAMKGGPLTVTHPEMTRFFMTIPQAVELVLGAHSINANLPTGTGRIFLLDMGAPQKITDIAQKIILLSGQSYTYDKAMEGHGIQILFSGIRPGEKLYEELLIEGYPQKTQNPKIYIAEPSKQAQVEAFKSALPNLRMVFQSGNLAPLLTFVDTFVEGHTISFTGTET